MAVVGTDKPIYGGARLRRIMTARTGPDARSHMLLYEADDGTRHSVVLDAEVIPATIVELLGSFSRLADPPKPQPTTVVRADRAMDQFGHQALQLTTEGGGSFVLTVDREFLLSLRDGVAEMLALEAPRN